jgi:DNA-directed RNA polymerase specialized sigma24 family protein
MTDRDADDLRLEELVERTIGGDEIAWKMLWRDVEARLERFIAQPRFLGPLGRGEDDRRNIVVDVMGRLRDDGFHRLQLYRLARGENPRLTFWTWLRVVAKRAGIDYMRGHPDYVDQRRRADRGSSPGRWVTFATLPPPSLLPDEAPSMTSRGTAAELLRHADASLPRTQLEALELWIQCVDHADIAERLQLDDAAAAERLVRAAIERLRRHFRSSANTKH